MPVWVICICIIEWRSFLTERKVYKRQWIQWLCLFFCHKMAYTLWTQGYWASFSLAFKNNKTYWHLMMPWVWIVRRSIKDKLGKECVFVLFPNKKARKSATTLCRTPFVKQHLARLCKSLTWWANGLKTQNRKDLLTTLILWQRQPTWCLYPLFA